MRVLAFDIESTSPIPTEARIVTIFLGVIEPDGSLGQHQEWLVRPDGFEIPEETTAIHGVSHAYVLEHGRPLIDVLREVYGALRAEVASGGLPVAGQNLRYDLTLLDRELGRVGGPGIEEVLGEGYVVLDSLILDKYLFKYRRGTGARKLVNLAEAYGVPLTEEEAHGASADAIAAGRIIQAQIRNPKLQGQSLRQIHDYEVQWAAEQAADLEAWFRSSKAGDRQNVDMVIERAWPYEPRAAA